MSNTRILFRACVPHCEKDTRDKPYVLYKSCKSLIYKGNRDNQQAIP